jgi:hypothetical protein
MATQAPTIHGKSLVTATALTEFQVMKPITPLEVIAVLNRERISFVLVGAYGLSGWTKSPRATQDVDVIVAAKHHKKAVKALLATFPQLEADDQEVVTRLRDREDQAVAVDVMKPNQLYRAAFKHTVQVRAGGQDYRIPSLEMALAMKFAPMISLTRADEKKHIDAHDFIVMVKVNSDIDLEQLAELGELVYSGGGQEIVELVRKVRAGERLQL